MNFLIGALGGAGDVLMRQGEREAKFETDQMLEAGRSAAAMAREQALVRLKQELADAPLLRLQGKAQALIGEQVPQEAAPVDRLSGAGVTYPDGAPSSGLQGDPAKLRAQAMAMPDGEDKTNILAQLDRQMTADKSLNQSAVAGKTRPRTSQEAMDAAVDWAKANDLPALAAYESAIGKPMRENRRIDVADRRATAAENRDIARGERDDKRLAQYDKKIDSQDAYNQRREERLDKMADLQERRLTQQGDKAETQSQRASVAALMNSTERELERTMTLAKDPVLDEATKKMFDGRVAGLTKDLARYRKSLESFGGDSLAKPEPEKAPARNGWDSGTGQVYKNGEVIGKAASEKEARSLFQGGAAKPAAAPARALIDQPKPEANPLAAQFEAETRQIEAGKRTAYSAEVMSFLDGQNAATASTREAGNAAYLERERRRALNNPLIAR